MIKAKEIMRQSTQKNLFGIQYIKSMHGQCKESRREVTVGEAVISPHICCFLYIEEGKNNTIYVR